MKFPLNKKVRVILPNTALNEIFDECDRFPDDETGGRVIGTFEEIDGTLVLRVTGIIEPGPRARRSPVMFFQDGEHQEQIFRQIEKNHPQVEHLGNWHTHHMNGLTHLSEGDVATYLRTVNHQQHNTPFFYAILVVSRTRSHAPHSRYLFKHYIALRGDKHVHEIPAQAVEFVDLPLVWPPKRVEDTTLGNISDLDNFKGKQHRAFNNAVLTNLYPGLHPYSSKKVGVYWRGLFDLIDGSTIETFIVEDSTPPEFVYSIFLRNPTPILQTVAETLKDQQFPTAVAALTIAERDCNRALWEHRHDQHQIESK